MTQEDKQLLLKVLCALSPYGVKVLYDGKVYEIQYVEPLYNEVKLLNPSLGYTVGIEDIKPYLRPMSSMTEEEFKELTTITELQYDQLELRDWDNGCKTLEFYLSEIPHYCVIKVFDWLDAHHFDYRGLIEKGLTIDCTGLHIYD